MQTRRGQTKESKAVNLRPTYVVPVLWSPSFQALAATALLKEIFIYVICTVRSTKTRYSFTQSVASTCLIRIHLYDALVTSQPFLTVIRRARRWECNATAFTTWKKSFGSFTYFSTVSWKFVLCSWIRPQKNYNMARRMCTSTCFASASVERI